MITPLLLVVFIEHCGFTVRQTPKVVWSYVRSLFKVLSPDTDSFFDQTTAIFVKNMTENSENTICNFLTSELPERYEVVRSVVYDRLNALYIKPTRIGSKSYVLPDDLLLLDDLHAHLSDGGKTEEFVNVCIETGSIVQPKAPLATNESALVQSSNQTETDQCVDNYSDAVRVEVGPSSSGGDRLGDMSSDRSLEAEDKDFAKLNIRAQERAFAIANAEDTLTVIYRATENFTIPGMKEKLEKNRRACDQAMNRGTVNADDFLSRGLESLGIGTSGSSSSANSNKDQLAS